MKKVTVNGEEVVLDPANLRFDEVTLNDFIKKFSANYAYYNQKWAEAQHAHYCAEDEYDTIYAQKVVHYKTEKASDKLADARAKSDEEVVEALKAVRLAKLQMQELYGYLRSLDKAHDDALNLGYNIRKEMDKIHPGIREPSNIRDYDAELDKLLQEDA